MDYIRYKQYHSACGDSCGAEGQADSRQPDAHRGHEHDDDHEHGADDHSSWAVHWPLLAALFILMVMLILEYGFNIVPERGLGLVIYIPAYLLSGYEVLLLAFRKALRLDFFNEFFLMSVATLGAFAIGSYSEGVAVMVFYSIGEWFQDTAVNNAKRSIKALLDIRPDKATVWRDGLWKTLDPVAVQIGDRVQLKPGERLAVDGILLSDRAAFDTAALTGESKPDNKEKGGAVYAGMINLNQLAEVEVSALFKDSKLSRILEMVQDATARKSQTQLFISRFAKIYTPVVFFLALLVVWLPMAFVADYIFSDWLYRGLVFLVISCPCALVVSIPLGYFGGIGLASRQGILFKGANYLDVMTKIDTVVVDKTGTMTRGVFRVQRVVTADISAEKLLQFAGALESKSLHPVALAVVNYAQQNMNVPLISLEVSALEEIAGHGLKGCVEGHEVLAGNTRLLTKFGISYDHRLNEEVDTMVMIAVDGRYVGHIIIADELKPDAAQAVSGLHALGIRVVMLSGDKQEVADRVASELKIDEVYGGLLPEDKVSKVQALKDGGSRMAFAGDGVNDAPVVALADAGIAMGGLGSDATVETADIVIQNDQPSRIVTAIKVGRVTRNVVWQNIVLAMSVKLIVLGLGAGGVATLWEAVIADVGVALLAILNAVRIQHLSIR